MESEALNILNDIGFGSAIALIMFIFGIWMSCKKWLEKHDEKIKSVLLTEKENTEYKKSVQEISDLLNKVIEEQQSVREQLNSITSKIENDKKESDAMDVKLESRIDNYEQTLKDVSMKVDASLEKFDILIDSDKETMKSFIIGQFKEAQKDGYVDWLVMESIEKIYKKYLTANGNTFIKSIIEEMRNMPKHNITTHDDDEEK